MGTKCTKGCRFAVWGLAWNSALITNEKLDKLKINDSSYTYQRTELMGQTAAPQAGGTTGGYREPHALKRKVTSSTLHGDQRWVPFTQRCVSSWPPNSMRHTEGQTTQFGGTQQASESDLDLEGMLELSG